MNHLFSGKMNYRRGPASRCFSVARIFQAMAADGTLGTCGWSHSGGATNVDCGDPAGPRLLTKIAPGEGGGPGAENRFAESGRNSARGHKTRPPAHTDACVAPKDEYLRAYETHSRWCFGKTWQGGGTNVARRVRPPTSPPLFRLVTGPSAAMHLPAHAGFSSGPCHQDHSGPLFFDGIILQKYPTTASSPAAPLLSPCGPCFHVFITLDGIFCLPCR
jgi:hypothetical protein